MNRTAQFELAFEDEPRPAIARRRPIRAPAPPETRAELHARGPAISQLRNPAALPASTDWASAREGVREVLLTVLATLAIGLSWAAIEAGRANEELVRAGAPVSQTGYARVNGAVRR
jgi:hypothetical protein